MRTPRLLGAAVCAAVILSGCSASTPEPTVGPASTGVVPVEYRTPEPTPSASPVTMRGPTGVDLPVIPSDPAATLECRAPTEAELRVLKWVAQRLAPDVAVVDVAGGWAVVAFHELYEAADGRTHALPNQGITDGGRSFQHVTPGWRGTHTLGGFALADGPKALEAARRCADS